MIKRYRILNSTVVLLPLVIFLTLSGCERPSKVPPSESALIVLESVKEGYNKQDADIFCKDFSDIMFTKGFTKKAYLDLIQGLKNQFGEWKSEIYLGEDRGVYKWRVKFKDGKSKLVLVFNNDQKIIGLWFR